MRIKKIVYNAMMISGFALALPTTVSATTISCGIGKLLSFPAIYIGEISEGLNIDDYGDNGVIGVTAVVSGNDKTATFSGTFRYTKVGGRIEIEEGSNISILQVKMDEFQTEFGKFPDVKCTTP